MKIKFRHHRGSLEESIKTLREFKTEEEMKQYISNEWGGAVKEEDIVIDKDTGEDKRIGWKNTHYVCVNKINGIDYIKKYGSPQCIGMCCIEE